MSRSVLTKYIILFTIVAQTNILGLVDVENLIFGGLPLFDIPIIILFIYCLFTFKQIKFRLNPLNLIVIVYVALTSLVIISMPFREEESILRAFQVGRHFYILLLVFVIEDCIYYNGDTKFIYKLINVIGTYFALIGILLSINPDIIGIVWQGLDTFSGDFKGETERSGLYSNGVLFIHIAFVNQLFKIIYNKEERNLLNYVFIVFFFIGMFFMGFRAVMFALLFSSVLISFFMLRHWVLSGVLSQTRLAEYILGGVLLIYVADFTLGGKISGLAQSVIDDASYTTATKKNTFEGRINRAMSYQIPTIMNNHPYIGMGFIYKTGITAKKYKHDPSVTNAWKNLYSVDFGYGSMWAKFGFIGSFFLLFVLLRAFWCSVKNARLFSSGEILQLSIVILGFLITNYTWAVLDMPQGLIVLAFSIGLASEYYYEYNKEPERLLQLD